METIKRMILLVILGSIGNALAQVGINTTNPNAMLDIQSSNQASPAPTDGLLIPKVNQFPLTNPTSSQDGMLIYLTTAQGANLPGFYYWKNAVTSWIPLLNGSNSGTLDNAYDFGGSGAGRTITADNGALTVDGYDGIVSTGSMGIGAQLPTGAGNRMVWNPRKSAFRAGFVSANHWNDSFTGLCSVAFGLSSIASGTSSMAFGSNSNATSNSSTAFGEFTTASGVESTAFGLSTTASGTRALAFGMNNLASNTDATVFGLNCQATGAESTAFGNLCTATGSASTAYGVFNAARSYGETAIGIYSVDYVPIGPATWIPSDRVFTIGNGVNSSTRSNAMVVFKSGLATLPSVYNTLIDLDATGKAIVTKEWVNANKGVSLDSAYDYGGAGSGRTITADSGSVEIQGAGGLNIIGTGRIGIGTNNPRAPLHVVGTSDAVTTGNMKFFNNAFGPLNVNPWSGFVSGYFEGDVLTRDSFVAAASVTFSDERVKKVSGISDGTKDLKMLNQIEIVDYTMIDSISNPKRYKKILAQQVEKLMPDAVDKYTDYLPSVYAEAEEISNTDGLTLVRLPIEHHFKQDDQVRLISEKQGEILATVEQITDDCSFQIKTDKPIEGKLFVYGKKVDDYRAVDYDAIAMLNVSATQELYRLLVSANQKIAALEKENATINNSLDDIKADVAFLKEFIMEQRKPMADVIAAGK